MSRRISIMIVGLSATAALALGGCSGTSTGGESRATPVAAPASASSPADAPSSSAASPSGDASTAGSSGGDSTGKPSKGEIVDGLTKFYTTKQNLSQTKAKKFATCMVDKMYDKASAKSLRAMEAGDPSQLDPADASLLTSSAGACASILQ